MRYRPRRFSGSVPRFKQRKVGSMPEDAYVPWWMPADHPVRFGGAVAVPVETGAFASVGGLAIGALTPQPDAETAARAAAMLMPETAPPVVVEADPAINASAPAVPGEDQPGSGEVIAPVAEATMEEDG